MKHLLPKQFLRIVATLMLLISLQSCKVCFELLSLGRFILEDYVMDQGNSGTTTYHQGTYKTSSRPTYNHDRNNSKGHQGKTKTGKRKSDK